MNRRALVAALFVCAGLGATVAAQKPCQVVQPLRTSLDRHASLPGALVPEQQLELKARVTGYLGEIPVDHGSAVERGGLLARVDVPDLEAALAKAEAAVAEAAAAVLDARAALELFGAKVDEADAGVAVCAADIALAEVRAARTRSLVEQRGATPQELDEVEGSLAMARARGQLAEAAVAAARAAVKSAEAAVGSADARQQSRRAELQGVRTMIGFARLECPFEHAVVTRRHLDPGALVQKDETVVLDLARLDKVRAEFHVPERDAVWVKVGTPVDLRFDALSDQTVQGVVSRTTRSVTSSKVMVVQVDLDNEDGRLLPGMFVYASLLLQSEDGALTLPARALRTDADGRHYVLVAAAGLAKKVAVELGADDGIRAQIAAGLAGDEAVIVTGAVQPGEKVRVVEASK